MHLCGRGNVQIQQVHRQVWHQFQIRCPGLTSDPTRLHTQRPKWASCRTPYIRGRAKTIVFCQRRRGMQYLSSSVSFGFRTSHTSCRSECVALMRPSEWCFVAFESHSKAILAKRTRVACSPIPISFALADSCSADEHSLHKCPDAGRCRCQRFDVDRGTLASVSISSAILQAEPVC